MKKQKLRHAEYYDFQGIQDDLYARSKKNHVFKHLVEIIRSEENIKLAYRNIKKNAGSRTAGVDGKSIRHVAKMSERQLVWHIQKRLDMTDWDWKSVPKSRKL